MKNFIPETIVSLESVAAVDAAVRDESNYNELKTFIVSFARLLSHNLSYEERHDALKAASKKKDSDEYSRFYLSFGVEAILAEMGCDFNITCPVYCYSPSEHLFSGTVVNFVNGKGITIDGVKVYADDKKVNGRWHIGYENGHAIVWKNYREYVIDHDDGVWNKIIIRTAPIRAGKAEHGYQDKLKKIGVGRKLEKAIKANMSIRFSYTGKSLSAVDDSGKEYSLTAINLDKLPKWYVEFIANKQISIDYVVLNNNEDSFDSGATYIFATIL